MPHYTFSENSSGGNWRLSREHYEKLMAAGWKYEPFQWKRAHDRLALKRGHDRLAFLTENGVPYGWRKALVGEFPTIRAAVEAWEAVTGMDFFEKGCDCCGAPFFISGDGDRDGEGELLYGDSERPW